MRFGLTGMLVSAIVMAGCSNGTLNVQPLAVETEAAKAELAVSEEEAIETYLTDNFLRPSAGEEIFAAYEILEDDTQAGEIYAWGLIEAYDHTQETTDSTKGVSIPLVLHVSRTNDSFEITGHTTPRDGSYYVPDVRSLFPAPIQDKILRYSSHHIHRLQKEMEDDVRTAKESGTP
ncbi:hypothetical protein ACFFSY_10165 [Paenibacillus aurantiacus]|uniref:Lipoprotein n=1 Tax=Paenibacillus aurantiacus TaxID=1936118 RepID=A0ABV5KM07_9BACL